jgi:transcriptional regulator with XRE-family HTH domain
MYIAELGARIRQARKARGTTQSALAERSGISRETLVQLESGSLKDLGIAKIFRLLAVVGLDVVILETSTAASTDYVALAATAASTGFREPLAGEELVRSLLTGKLPARKAPHLRRLLEDTPARVVRGLVVQVSAWAKAGSVERNVAALARALDVELRTEWTSAP